MNVKEQVTAVEDVALEFGMLLRKVGRRMEFIQRSVARLHAVIPNLQRVAELERRAASLERQCVRALEALDEIQDYVEGCIRASHPPDFADLHAINNAIRKARMDVLAAAEGRQE